MLWPLYAKAEMMCEGVLYHIEYPKCRKPSAPLPVTSQKIANVVTIDNRLEIRINDIGIQLFDKHAQHVAGPLIQEIFDKTFAVLSTHPLILSARDGEVCEFSFECIPDVSVKTSSSTFVCEFKTEQNALNNNIETITHGLLKNFCEGGDPKNPVLKIQKSMEMNESEARNYLYQLSRPHTYNIKTDLIFLKRLIQNPPHNLKTELLNVLMIMYEFSKKDFDSVCDDECNKFIESTGRSDVDYSKTCLSASEKDALIEKLKKRNALKELSTLLHPNELDRFLHQRADEWVLSYLKTKSGNPEELKNTYYQALRRYSDLNSTPTSTVVINRNSPNAVIVASYPFTAYGRDSIALPLGLHEMFVNIPVDRIGKKDHVVGKGHVEYAIDGTPKSVDVRIVSTADYEDYFPREVIDHDTMRRNDGKLGIVRIKSAEMWTVPETPFLSLDKSHIGEDVSRAYFDTLSPSREETPVTKKVVIDDFKSWIRRGIINGKIDIIERHEHGPTSRVIGSIPKKIEMAQDTYPRIQTELSSMTKAKSGFWSDDIELQEISDKEFGEWMRERTAKHQGPLFVLQNSCSQAWGLVDRHKTVKDPNYFEICATQTIWGGSGSIFEATVQRISACATPDEIKETLRPYFLVPGSSTFHEELSKSQDITGCLYGGFKMDGNN